MHIGHWVCQITHRMFSKALFSMTCDTSMYICATDLGNLIGSVPGQVLFDRKSMHERKIQLGSLFHLSNIVFIEKDL